MSFPLDQEPGVQRILFDGTRKGEWGQYLGAVSPTTPTPAPESDDARQLRTCSEDILDVLATAPAILRDLATALPGWSHYQVMLALRSLERAHFVTSTLVRVRTGARAFGRSTVRLYAQVGSPR